MRFPHLTALLALASLVHGCATAELTREQAIRRVQQQHPELSAYPSDRLPPRSIEAVRDPSSRGWSVAFLQLGSGRPLIAATCFRVLDEGTVTRTGEYRPVLGESADIDPRTCRPHREAPAAESR